MTKLTKPNMDPSTYVYTGYIVDEYINTSSDSCNALETYNGKIHKRDMDNMIMVKLDKGTGILTYTLYLCRIAHIEFLGTEGMDVEAFFYRKQPELIPKEEDYHSIASIYKCLTRMGIVVESCTFVRFDGTVYMQNPRGITLYTCPGRAEYLYKNSDCIACSLPQGLEFKKLVKLLFPEE